MPTVILFEWRGIHGELVDSDRIRASATGNAINEYLADKLMHEWSEVNIGDTIVIKEVAAEEGE